MGDTANVRRFTGLQLRNVWLYRRIVSTSATVSYDIRPSARRDERV